MKKDDIIRGDDVTDTITISCDLKMHRNRFSINAESRQRDDRLEIVRVVVVQHSSTDIDHKSKVFDESITLIDLYAEKNERLTGPKPPPTETKFCGRSSRYFFTASGY